MYTEGYEGLEEAEQSSRRAYVSNVSQDDAEKLLRENERLKKQLEKERFFNKLLDQEIQELKNNAGQQEHHYSSYWYGPRGVSKGAFYSLLFVSLAMAAYIGYGIYYDKQFNYLKELTPAAASSTNDADKSGETTDAFTTPPAATENKITETEQEPQLPPVNDADDTKKSTVSQLPPASVETKPVTKDSVPNIIASTNKQQAQQASRQKAAAPVAVEQKEEEIDVDAETFEATPEPIDTRPVIGRYKISSKANFYFAPDENALRNTFISAGDDKIVGALEEKNGFIYVVYINDLGYTTKGWLSKKDLTKL